MVIFPVEWHDYMYTYEQSNKNCCFRKDTPPEIIEKAKAINEAYESAAGRPFFHFEGEEDEFDEKE